MGLVISEMTVDVPPGAEGAWIELYNPGAESLQVEITTVVYNGREVYRMPQLSVPPQALVLVRFSREVPEREREWERRKKENPKLPAQPWWQSRALGGSNAIELWAPPVFDWKCPTQYEERKPGCCAVFQSADLREEEMLDFVFWGDASTRDEVDATHRTWAEKRGLWAPTGATIQTLPAIPCWIPPIPGVLARMSFGEDLHRVDAWIGYGENRASPGAGNRWPPPWLECPGGMTLDPTDPFVVQWSSYIPSNLLKKDPLPGRFQVARDPHFQDVVMDIRVPIAPVFPEGVDLAPGKYYARIKCEAGPISTDWSEAEFFSYHLPLPGAPPAAP
ncbi:MAG: hypothetical protein WBD63_00775 [Phycisphaerae bacterium]